VSEENGVIQSLVKLELPQNHFSHFWLQTQRKLYGRRYSRDDSTTFSGRDALNANNSFLQFDSEEEGVV
jgi:hypothetical protein